MKRYLLLTVLLFSLYSGMYAQQSTPAILQVQINDVSGNPVPNYPVLIRPGGDFKSGEVIINTDAMGFALDTVQLPGSLIPPSISYIVLDSTSTGITQYTSQFSFFSMPPAYTVVDTVFFTLKAPLRGMDNCGTYSAWADSVVNDPMFVRFPTNLKYPVTGTTWTYGDGDTGHAPQSFHRYDTAGTYYFCHYTDSCGPVCDSVTVPTKVPTCVVNPFYVATQATVQGAQMFFNSNYPSTQVDSVKWTFSGGLPSSSFRFLNMYMPAGNYQYCLQVNNCPVFCDSITINGQCEASFEITNTTTSGDVFIDNTSLPKPNDSVEVIYKWTFGDGNISNDAFPIHNYQTSGPYNLCLDIEVIDKRYNTTVCASRFCLQVNGGVPGSGFSLNVLNPYIGLEGLTIKDLLSIYPNPVNKVLTVSLQSGVEISRIVIYDVIGNQVFRYLGEKRNEVHLTLDNLKKGIYLMEVETTTGNQITKFVKN